MAFYVLDLYSILREAVYDAGDHKNNIVIGKKTSTEAAVKELYEIVDPSDETLIVAVKV